MERLFLDANIFLDFYRFGEDDISEVDKLRVLISGDDIELITNHHLLSEINRNREKVISESLSELRGSKLKIRAPNYCKKDDTYLKLNKTLKDANKLHQKLILEIEERVRDKKLSADVLIKGLLDGARQENICNSILERAKLRVALRNPPGKAGSLGDAVHWECLLAAKDISYLAVVCRDSDFSSELDKNKMKDVLINEWTEQKGYGTVRLYTSLSEYFGENFPDIKLSDEAKKHSLISQLEASPNFATTHILISELSEFSYFTTNQIRRLFDALLHNSQVSWIASDDDIREFFLKLEHRAHVVSKEKHDAIAELLGVSSIVFFLGF